MGSSLARRAISASRRADLGIQAVQHADHRREARAGRLWDFAVGILDLDDQAVDVHDALRGDVAVLGQVTAQGVHELRALTDQQVPGPEDHAACLLLAALHRHEAHGRPLSRLADRLGVGRVVLLALDEGLHVGRRDQPDLWPSLISSRPQ